MRLEESSLLAGIVAGKCQELAGQMCRASLASLKELAAQAPPARDFLAALAGPGLSLIAEIKPASPSAGSFASALSLEERAMAYAKGGAAGLSILTESRHFGGSLENLSRARAVSDLPLLRKDFIVDPWQVYEARAAGADAVLLMASVLEPGPLRALYQLCRQLGMAALLEVHDQAELETVLAIAPPLLGINNRDLRSMRVDLDTCLRLREFVPAGVTVVAESGVNSAADMARLAQGGLDAALVGSHLMRAADPGQAVADLLAGARP